MNAELWISRRLALKAEGSRRMAVGVSIAVGGIALAMVIMMLSIAIVIGFKQEIKQKVSGFESQVMIYPAQAMSPEHENPGIRLTDSLRATIASVMPEAEVGIALRRPAIFKTDNAFQGIVLKGMTSRKGLEFVERQLVEGSLPPEHPDSLNYVTISSNTANALGLKPGDRILTHFLHNNNLRTRPLKVSGIYNTHFSDYDDVYAFVPMGMLQKLSRVDSITGSVVEMRGLDDEKVDELTQNLHDALIQDILEHPDKGVMYAVDNVHHTGAMYFTWLSLLDTNVAVILTLMAVVSGFTLISCMFILILERVRMIGLLKAMGASNGFVRKIFIYMAQRIVWRGLLIGNVVPLDADAYYLDYVPVEIGWWWILALNAATILVAWLILILPSQIISRMSPAESMHYE